MGYLVEGVESDSRGSMQPQKQTVRVAVLGGGISGLSAAYRLREILPHADVHLYEASDQLGGVLQTTRTQDGYLFEHSADNFITNLPQAIDLCDRLGIKQQLLQTNDALRKAFVLRKGNLYPVPDGFLLMAPGKIWPVLTTPILSVAGKLRLARERFIPASDSSEDESLKSFVTRRLGTEVYERLVQPLIGGIYTADPTKLSTQATLQQFVEMERKHGSLTIGMQRRQANTKTSDSGARYSMFMAPRNGMHQIVEAIQQSIPHERIHLNAPIKSLVQQGKSWAVQCKDQQEVFDAVVVALPAPKAAEVLDSQSQLAASLSEINYAGCNVAIIAVDESQITKPIRGFGFVVPEIETRRVLAVSFSSYKFEGRVPQGKVILRVFVGGACHPELTELTDTETERVVLSELSDLVGLKGKPEHLMITRWNGKMPQYHLGHLQLVDQIEELAKQLDGLELAGNAYRGVGVPQCIASGQNAADRVQAYLAAKGPSQPETNS